MKILYKINKAILVLTLILYITIIFGLYSQILLGGVQVLSGIILFFYWNKLSKSNKEKLILYWSLVLIYGSFWLFGIETGNSYFFIFGIIIIPMGLSAYFILLLKDIKINYYKNYYSKTISKI